MIGDGDGVGVILWCILSRDFELSYDSLDRRIELNLTREPSLVKRAKFIGTARRLQDGHMTLHFLSIPICDDRKGLSNRGALNLKMRNVVCTSSSRPIITHFYR